MNGLAYLFERFPSFTQTFCYREISALYRQGVQTAIFSVRQPVNEPAQEGAASVVKEGEDLPGDEPLMREVDQAGGKRKIHEPAARQVAGRGRQHAVTRL